MRHIFLLPFVLILLTSCTSGDDDNRYTGKALEYELFQANDAYNYSGTVVFKEIQNGQIETVIRLSGDKGTETYYFPAHLHFGPYDAPDAPMAAMLTPVDLKTLESLTIVGELSNGETLSFEDLQDFDGHIKVHLASDGPDYHVILVAGNIGANADTGVLDRSKMTLCAPNY